MLTNSRVEIHWEPPTEPNGVVETYRLFKAITQRPFVLSSTFGESVLHTEDNTVQPGVIYQYKVGVQTGGGTTNSSAGVIEMPLQTPLNIPPLSLVRAISATAIYVEWDYPSTPNGVIDQYVLVLNGGSMNELVSGQGVGSSATITGLKPDTVYDVRIQACLQGIPRGCGTGPGVEVRTLEAAPTGQNPPTLIARGPRAVDVMWDPPDEPNGEITQYRINRRLFGINNNGLLINIVGGDTFTFLNAAPDLLPFREYEYRVTAVNQQGETPSTWAKVRTLEAPPQMMTAPTITAIDAFSLSVDWEPPLSTNGVVKYYRVEYRRASNDPTVQYPLRTVTVPNSVTETSVSGLRPFSQYEIRVQAVNAAGQIASDWVNTETSQAAPSNLALFTVEQISNGLSLILRWDEPGQPNGILTNYHVYEEGNVNSIYQGLNREFEFRRLQPYTEYFVQLEACTLGGCAKSMVQTVRTAEIMPENQPVPVVESLSATSVRVRWNPPVDPNGRILRFQIIRRTASRIVKRDTSVTYSPETIVYETQDTGLDENEFTDSNLKPYKTYEYKVRAMNSQGSTDSPWQMVTTAQAAPEGVASPVVSHVAGKFENLRVTWNEPLKINGILHSYQLQRNNSIPYSFAPDAERTFVDSGLLPFTVYSYTVTACTTGGCTTSPATVIRTQETAPYFVNPPQLTSASSTAIQVSWLPPQITNGQIREYRLSVDGDTRYIGQDTSFLVDNLTPYQAYLFVLTACTNGGCQDSSSVQGRPEEAPPTGMRVPALRVTSSTSIEVTWDAPEYSNGVITSYEVRRDGTLVFTTTTALQFTDYEVQPGQEYSYRVTVFNSQGSAVSPAAVATTYSSSPSGMEAPLVEPVSSIAIKAEWQPPLRPNGDIHNYTLYVNNEVVYSARGLSTTVQGLEFWTEYSVRVEACTANGCAVSNPALVRTLEAPPMGMLAPTLRALTNINGAHDGVSVTWSPPRRPNGVITKYNLYRRLYTGLRPGEFVGNALVNSSHFPCTVVKVSRNLPFSNNFKKNIYKSSEVVLETEEMDLECNFVGFRHNGRTDESDLHGNRREV